MTRQEVQTLLATIQAFYPNFKVENQTITVNAWLMLLEEREAQAINSALKAYVTESHEFAPNPGKLIQKAYDITEADNYPSEAQAWDMVWRAIQDSTWHEVESFNKLPEIVQKAVGSANNLHAMAIAEIDDTSYLKNDFINSYRITLQRVREAKTQPKAVTQFITESRVKAIEGGDK